MTNPGAVTTREVVAMIVKHLKPDRAFHFWKNDREFYAVTAKAPRSNCILDSSKLLGAGVRMRNVTDALRDALVKWQPKPSNIEMMSAISGSLSEVDLSFADPDRTVSLPTGPFA